MSESNNQQASREQVQRQRRIKLNRSYQDWVRIGMIALIAMWLIVAVVLPLIEVVDRAVHDEFVVAIWGADDIRIAGHQVVLEDGQVIIDGDPAVMEGSTGKLYGVTATFGDDRTVVRTATVMTDSMQQTTEKIRPIEVVIEGDSWYIDGTLLPGDEYQMTVQRYIGLRNFIAYFTSPAMRQPVQNSIFVAIVTTLISVVLAFFYAYAIERTQIRGKALFRVIALLPLFAPTMLYGLSLVYLFGNQGLITKGFFGKLPWLATDIGLYGPVGIIISEVVFTFPAAVIILLVALSNTDARLYEAAESLGAGTIRKFFTVTLPSVKYGVLSAVFVAFTLSFTDFGAPKVVGGNFNVLAVDIYKQVVGQQNFGMGATVSLILLIPTVLAFIADRIVQRRQVVAVTARSVPFRPKRNRLRDGMFFGLNTLIALFILTMVFTAGFASLVKLWPYQLDLGFWHYSFEGMGGGGLKAFWNSIRMSAYSAIFGTAITFLSAYLIEKTKGMLFLRQAAYFLSIIPLALPGLVIGIAYIFFFNKPVFEIPFTSLSISNPLTAVYGTMVILVIANVVHFYTVSFLTATTALRQMDKEFEAVSESMSVPFYKTFFRVTVPVCLPAVLEIAAFYFVSSMATVSAVIFLYAPDTKLASVAVINMADAGDIAPAAAMCILIVLANIAVRVLFEIGSRLLKRTQAWRTR